MSFERLIASRFLSRDKSNFSRPLVRIAIYTVALGVLVMVMAVSILRGFQNEITNKVVGFGSHITIRSHSWVNDYDEKAVVLDPEEIKVLASIPGVSNIQAYAYKGGMMKTDDQILGIIFKGVDSSFDTLFFARNMVRGRFFHFEDSSASDEIIISQRIASLMGLDTGSKVRTYFWVQNNYRARAFRVVGIYNTDLNEFDSHYLVGDLRQVQKLNQWEQNEVAGYEILIDDFSQLYPTLVKVKENTRYDLLVTSIREEQPSMFAWLDLLNSNIILIIVIIAIVCAACVASSMLIMIFEKTSMIGLLKTLGSTNRSIRRIFMIKAARIVGTGIIAGDIIALVLCLLQNAFHIIKLDSESYSMTFVPIDLNIWYFLAISAGTLLVCLSALLLPSTYIAHIDPARTMRVE
ncbi:MAG: ABC transporter permease [Bacteroidales bacterium]|nr:ABC transporter permease [Bacteroidales bacterium]